MRSEEVDVCFTSQTKPGPNMAFAVARNSARKESREEKSEFIWLSRACGMGTGVGEMYVKNRWLLWAIEAWLKRDAWLASRACLIRRVFVRAFSSTVPGGR